MEEDEKKRILIIEDEKHISEGLKLNLSLKGYEVFVAGDGIAGLQQWKDMSPDLIILDIMLPGIDGLSILQSIRLEDEKIPILILSAKNKSIDKIKGLECGVDDYLGKPFELEEFLLRVKRLLKRTSWNNQQEIKKEQKSNYYFGDNNIDFAKNIAYCKAGTINLTEQESRVLKLFISNKGTPLHRKKLLEIGWGYAKGTTSRTIDNFIVRFRKYFEDNPKKPKYFKSRRAVGYIFDHE